MKLGTDSDSPFRGEATGLLSLPKSGKTRDIIRAHVSGRGSKAVKILGSTGVKWLNPVARREPGAKAVVDRFDIVVWDEEIVTDKRENREEPDIPDCDALVI